MLAMQRYRGAPRSAFSAAVVIVITVIAHSFVLNMHFHNNVTASVGNFSPKTNYLLQSMYD
jgi:hypothetical protein